MALRRGRWACGWYRLYFFPALILAHLARCAAAIRRLPAADILCLGPGVFACFVAFCFAPPSSRCNTWFSREICSLISCVMDSRLMRPLVSQMRMKRIARAWVTLTARDGAIAVPFTLSASRSVDRDYA